MREDDGLKEGGCGEGSDSGCFEGRPMGFADGLDMSCEKNRSQEQHLGF